MFITFFRNKRPNTINVDCTVLVSFSWHNLEDKIFKENSYFRSIHWCMWSKLIELRSMPSEHVIFFLIELIESCCWRQVLANDSIANIPLRRLNRIIPTTKRTVSTTKMIVAMTMRKISSRSANRNFNRTEQINYKIFHWDILVVEHRLLCLCGCLQWEDLFVYQTIVAKWRNYEKDLHETCLENLILLLNKLSFVTFSIISFIDISVGSCR